MSLKTGSKIAAFADSNVIINLKAQQCIFYAGICS